VTSATIPGRVDRSGVLILLIVAACAIPMIVAIVVLRDPRYFPVGDLAEIELRIRDVGTSHPPLVGMVGRLGPLWSEGSHPGPLGFWVLWPFYRLYGASSWSMSISSVALHLVAIATILWIANRRGGTPLVLGVGVVLAVLLRAYEPSTVTQAWTPYLPLLWWFVFLFGIWSVLRDDMIMLPVAAFAGTLCAQAHIGYVGLVVVVGALGVGFAVRRRAWRSLAFGGAAAVLLWLPPIVQELRYSPGNFSVLRDYFLHNDAPTSGFGDGLRIMLVHLNPWRLIGQQLVLTIRAPSEAGRGVADASLVPGTLFLVAWMASVVVAARRSAGTLLRLDLVLAAALLAGFVSASRIIGPLWYWLVMWAWTITALMMLATGWALALLVAQRVGGSAAISARASVWATRGAVALIALCMALLGVDARHPEVQGPRLSRVLGGLVPDAVATLRNGTLPGTGRNGRYLLTWTDPVLFDIKAWGVLNELTRAGFDVGVAPEFRAGATPYHLMDAGDASAEVHMSVGADLDVWRAKPGAHQIAFVDLASTAERAEFPRIRAEVIADLEAAGLRDAVPLVDNHPLTAAFDPHIPLPIRQKISRLIAIGLPTAIFVASPPPPP
jgi:hypothetical protein